MDRTLISYIASGCSFLCRSVSFVLDKFTRWRAKSATTILGWRKRCCPDLPIHSSWASLVRWTLAQSSLTFVTRKHWHVEGSAVEFDRGYELINDATVGERGQWYYGSLFRWVGLSQLFNLFFFFLLSHPKNRWKRVVRLVSKNYFPPKRYNSTFLSSFTPFYCSHNFHKSIVMTWWCFYLIYLWKLC